MASHRTEAYVGAKGHTSNQEAERERRDRFVPVITTLLCENY
jgi:hypothetical protein